MTPATYLGVSGFMSQGEVRAAIAAFPDCGRLLMVGVLASAKTLAGQQNRYPLRYPQREDIAGIFLDDPRCLNLVHVAVDRCRTAEPWLDRAFFYGGARCHGVQFNVPSPENRFEEKAQTDAIRFFLRLYPEARLVLQLRPASIDELSARAELAHEAGATDVLLDASGGRGLWLDAPSAALAAQRIRGACPRLGIGIAGGLCAETVPGVAQLIRDGYSIDAERKLRDGEDGGGNLDLHKVRAYLQAAAEATR